MKKLLKRAFTIVELVIVIAVIAILAAVLVPTFSNIVRKAHKSADVQLAKNLNTVMTMATSEGRVAQSMYDVLYLCSESGYLLENLNPTSDGYYFAWDSKTNKILYICSNEKDLDTVEYPEDYKLNPVTCWITVGNKEEAEMVANAGYNIYLKNSIDNIELHNVAVSIDTGACSLGTLTIDGELADAKSITLTGNYSTELSVTASNVNFSTSGTIKSLTIGSNVSGANLGSNVGTLSTAINNTSVSGTGMIQNVNSSSTGSITIGNQTYKADEITVTNISGASDGIIPISSRESIENIRSQIVGGRTFEGETIQLTADIDMGGIAYQPMSNYDRDHKENAPSWFRGSFDGNNKTIYNVQLGENLFSIGTLNAGTNDSSCKFGLNAETYQEANYGLLGTVYVTKDRPVTIKNLTIIANIDLIKNDKYSYVGDSVAALIGFAYGDGTLTIENVTIGGTIKSFDGCAAFIGRAYGSDSSHPLDIRFINCTNNAEIVAVRKAGAFLGSGNRWKSTGNAGNKVTLYFENCVNNGNIHCLDGETYDGTNIASCYEMTELASTGYQLGVSYMKAGCASFEDGDEAPEGVTNNGHCYGHK